MGYRLGNYNKKPRAWYKKEGQTKANNHLIFCNSDHDISEKGLCSLDPPTFTLWSVCVLVCFSTQMRNTPPQCIRNEYPVTHTYTYPMITSADMIFPPNNYQGCKQSRPISTQCACLFARKSPCLPGLEGVFREMGWQPTVPGQAWLEFGNPRNSHDEKQTEGQGDGSVDNVLAVWTWGPEFEPQQTWERWAVGVHVPKSSMLLEADGKSCWGFLATNLAVGPVRDLDLGE